MRGQVWETLPRKILLRTPVYIQLPFRGGSSHIRRHTSRITPRGAILPVISSQAAAADSTTSSSPSTMVHGWPTSSRKRVTCEASGVVLDWQTHWIEMLAVLSDEL
jgi:hypothetical protein